MPNQELHEYWTPIVNSFDPYSMLMGEQLETFFVKRADNPLERLKLALRPDRIESQTILTGHIGNGKSSELAKFAQTISEDYYVIWIDLQTSSQIESVNQLDVLAMLGFAVYKVANAELSDKPNRELLEGLVNSLSTLIKEEIEDESFEIDIAQILGALTCFGIGVAVGGPAGLAAASIARPLINGFTGGINFSLGASSKKLRKLEMGPQLSEVIKRVQAIIRDVEDKAQKPLFLMVDGLDKIKDLEHAHTLFANSWVLRAPPCRVIYTAPIHLSFSPDYSQVRERFLTIEFPNIKLHKRAEPNERNEEGWQTMRHVVYKRIHTLEMTVEDVIVIEALDLIIEMSGGVMRQMIRLMRDAALEAELSGQQQIDLLAAHKAIYNLQRDYARPLARPEKQELIEFQSGYERSGTELWDKLSLNSYILSYVNDHLWYDINPIVRALL